MTTIESAGADVLDDLNWWTRPVAERDALFARLRAENPRPFVPELDLNGTPRGGGFWALTRLDDIKEVSKRPDDFRSGAGINIFDQPPRLKEYRGSIIDMDNPEHARQRRIVSRGFTAKTLEALREDVLHTSRDIIGAVAGRGECDFVTEVAALIPLRIVNNMMGIPRSQERFIFDQTNIIMAASDPEYVADQTPRGVAGAVMAAGERLAGLLQELAEDRIKAPKDDLITALVAARTEENLTPQELASFFILLVGAGNETTRNAIAHGLLALTRFPEQNRLWQSDLETHTARAVEELVRWSSPVLHMRRTVTRDGVRLGEQEFSAGDKVVLWYRSANQDEQYFADPTAFDITREPNPHVTFGSPGPHHCLGANLARLELSVAFRTLFELLPDIRAVGEPDPLRSNFLHGIKHLRAEFTPVAK
ncbi:cytochrome P450 [Amycolatopsis acidiphila]|uniref:Cytochrome P450 n=1 Tax=Amycolatopsis acidiphila TaxID=715473 RepID=A0A558AP29_9PSEU|nr:cytochrome P450 [Amycolatopsis acidiphila]TVT26014.1 cytochrome P450 [Amycolatopsis acidiphila]UIJ63272.1 cytochrome P450 [Amycolatopsis acidiphila]GHG74708.1 linalool 8-monooxygenase [Amycolatopsis acidiphila]